MTQLYSRHSHTVLCGVTYGTIHYNAAYMQLSYFTVDYAPGAALDIRQRGVPGPVCVSRTRAVDVTSA